jgi:DNA-binding transcriptional ArsR family regulator
MVAPFGFGMCSIYVEHCHNVRSPSNMSRAREEAVPNPSSARARALTHADVERVSLHAALEAVADPVRRTILRELANSPPWTRACGTFDVPQSKATLSHHFGVLRAAGLLEQRDDGTRRLNRLRREEFDERFPGLLALVLDDDRHGD